MPRLDSGELDARGKNIVVIGGGDTAMDCVRTAIRQGAESVTCLYRRDRAHMPGSAREVAHAEEEGVRFLWQAQPRLLRADKNGRLRAIAAERLHLGLADGGDRPVPRAIPDSAFEIAADMAILALGFEPEDVAGRFALPDLALGAEGRLRVAPASLMTNLPGIFAAGDIVRGASLVVWAIRDGRDAAAGIDAYLTQIRQRSAAA